MIWSRCANCGEEIQIATQTQDPKNTHVCATKRLSMHEIMLRFAELLAERGTCRRLQVGAVITDEDMLQILGVGYNGNAKGFRNDCDTAHPGLCGCLHAEINALLKAPGAVPNKQMFVTHTPCLMCAKAIINSRITMVTYRHTYRDPAGLMALTTAGITLYPFTAPRTAGGSLP